MSHIANAIDALLKEHNKSAAELARASGVNEAQISRLKSAAQVWVNADDLVSISKGLTTGKSEMPKIHARLLYAHLQDECSGPGSKLISIDLMSAPDTSADVLHDAPVLPPRVKENLIVITEHVSRNRHIRDMLEVIANLCRSQSAPAPSE